MALNVDVADLIDEFRITGGVTIERAAEPTLNSRGEPVAQTPSTTAITDVAVHTVNGRELDRLPEADRRKEAIRVYTKVQVRTAGGGYRPDVILYDSKRYEVRLVDDYSRQGGVWISTAVLQEAT